MHILFPRVRRFYPTFTCIFSYPQFAYHLLKKMKQIRRLPEISLIFTSPYVFFLHLLVIVSLLLLRLPWWLSGRRSICKCRKHRRHGFNLWVRKTPGGGNGIHTSILPGKTHGQRFMAGYSPWGYKEPDSAEHTQSVLSQSKNRGRNRKGISVEDLL